MVFLFFQMALEPALWWPWPPFGSRLLFGRTALALLVLAPVSGLLVQHYLARRTPPGTSIPVWLRAALFLGGCVPWVGLLLIPLWRRLMTSPPTWAVHPQAARLDLDTPPARLPRGSPLHRLYTSGAFGFWLIITGVLLPLAGCLWLAKGGNRSVILGACAALHLAQAACLALYAESELRFTTQSRRSLRLVPWLCLLPQPVPFLAMFPVLWTEVESLRVKTLTWSAYARRVGVGRLSVWLDLRLALQKRWTASPWRERWTLPRGLEISPREGRAEAARRTWVRAKSLLLPIEASLAIGWLVAFSGGGPIPDYDPVRDPALRPWLLAAALLAALGLLQAVAAGLVPLLRLRASAPLGPPKAGLSLFVTQAALAFGLLAGPLAVHGKFRELALLTVLSAALAAMLSVLVMMARLLTSRPVALATLVTWPLSLLLLGVLPMAVVLRPDLAWVGLGLALLVPVVDIGVGVWSLPWLLYPFRWRDVFEGKIAVGVRVRLAFVALVALLPLGGIALPVWFQRKAWETPERTTPGANRT
jgi:hypothetical protein